MLTAKLSVIAAHAATTDPPAEANASRGLIEPSVSTVIATSRGGPDLEACLAIQSEVPPGWTVVTRDGSAVVTQLAAVVRKLDALIPDHDAG